METFESTIEELSEETVDETGEIDGDDKRNTVRKMSDD